MRTPPPKPLILSFEELQAVKDEAERRGRGQGFSSEEMQILREQYEARVLEEQQKREQIEWKLRMALARLKDVEEALRSPLADAEPEPQKPGRKLPPIVAPPRRARA